MRRSMWKKDSEREKRAIAGDTVQLIVHSPTGLVFLRSCLRELMI